MDEQVVLEGYLGKQGSGLSKGYKRRFFRLTREDEIHYYKTEKDAFNRKSQGFINIRKVQSVERGSEVVPKRSVAKKLDNYFFDVVTEDRIYHLTAATEAEQLSWMASISNAVRNINPLSNLSPITKFVPELSRSFSESVRPPQNSPIEPSRESIHNIPRLVKHNSLAALSSPEKTRPSSIDCSITDCSQLLSAINTTVAKRNTKKEEPKILPNEGTPETSLADKAPQYEEKLRIIKEEAVKEQALRKVTVAEIEMLNKILLTIRRHSINPRSDKESKEMEERKAFANLVAAHEKLSETVQKSKLEDSKDNRDLLSSEEEHLDDLVGFGEIEGSLGRESKESLANLMLEGNTGRESNPLATLMYTIAFQEAAKAHALYQALEASHSVPVENKFHKFNQLDAQREELQSKRKELTQELYKQPAPLPDTSTLLELENLKGKNDELMKEVVSSRVKLQEIEAENVKLRATLEASNGETKNLSKQIEIIRQERGEIGSQLESVREETKELKRNSSSAIESATSDVEQWKAKYLKQEEEELKRQHQSSGELEKIQAERDELQHSFSEVQRKLKELEDKVQQSSASIFEKGLREKEMECANLSELHQTIEEERALLEHDRKKDKEAIRELQMQLKSKDAILLSIKDNQEKLQGFSSLKEVEKQRAFARLKAANHAHQHQNSQLVQEISSVKEHFMAKIEGRENTIEKLKEQLDFVRSQYQNSRRDMLIKSGGVDHSVIQELDAISDTKRQLFYEMAVGIKLEFSTKGTPCNLNIGELYDEASHTVPIHQWATWLHTQFGDAIKDSQSLEEAIRSSPRVKAKRNTVEM